MGSTGCSATISRSGETRLRSPVNVATPHCRGGYVETYAVRTMVGLRSTIDGNERGLEKWKSGPPFDGPLQRGLGRANVLGARTLRALGDFELDLLTADEAVEI